MSEQKDFIVNSDIKILFGIIRKCSVEQLFAIQKVISNEVEARNQKALVQFCAKVRENINQEGTL